MRDALEFIGFIASVVIVSLVIVGTMYSFIDQAQMQSIDHRITVLEQRK